MSPFIKNDNNDNKGNVKKSSDCKTYTFHIYRNRK